jgi:K+-sensing histidine kinase KdpD
MPRTKIDLNGQTGLIKMLAHDLRNPISGILAASQCLLEDASPVLDSQQMSLLRSIESSTDLLLELIEDMLEVALAGKSKLNLRPADLSRLVDQIAAVQQPIADAKKIRLQMRRDDIVPPIDLDPRKMTHALNALLKDVVRSSPPEAEIEIDITARQKDVVISIRHLSFSHRAPGPNSAGDSFRRGKDKPSSLTLSAVRAIVEGHGGAMRVAKDARQPAFMVLLPRSRSSAHSDKAADKPKAKRFLAAG